MSAAPNATEIRHTIGAGGSLALRNVSGRVRLVGTDSDEAIVVCRSDRDEEPRLNVERTEGGLLVEPERRSRSFFNMKLIIDFDHSYDFEVRVPRGARIDVKTVSADVDGRDLTGDQHYKTVSGDVRLAGAAGRMSVMTVSGDVRLHDASELELDGATTSGDFTVEAAVLRALGLRTVSGDVRVRGLLQPGPRHSVESVSGDLNLESAGGVTVESSRALDLGRGGRQPQVVGDGSARLVFRTMSGDQRVMLNPAVAGSDPQVPAQPPSGPAPAADDQTRIAILRAVERGEIDIDEAARRLEEVANG